MCGIVGFWSAPGATVSSSFGERMAATLTHRGPDDSGSWVDEDAGVVLSHRRLSVVDLSQAGHQPMNSSCGRYVLSYNGEIYNHLDLREELNDLHRTWRGHSDTETLLAGFTHWGFAKTLERSNGMFALALWDRAERKLYLARDRMGEKPLYYGFIGTTFVFGSELKALRAHPHWQGELDRNALSLFFRHQYIPAPHTVYRGINKLLPAHYAVVQCGLPEPVATHCYWDLRDIAAAGVANAHQADAAELTDRLDVLLRDAVGKRMMADVPLGAFLSGGYDSTMVVAQMQAQAQTPVRTFSIGFEDQDFDEAPHAKKIANHLGTNHTELYVTPEQALGVIPLLSSIWDEPFSDSSQIPTYLVAKLARENVTVSLSGDGGDELFYGYGRYVLSERIWKKLSLLPKQARPLIGALLKRLPGRALERIAQFSPRQLGLENLADRLPKVAPLIAQTHAEQFYRAMISHWKEPLVLGASEPTTIFTDTDKHPELPGLAEMMMYLDAVTYLPDDILTKVDRASMAVSLEARVPLLDHRLVEFAWQIPTRLKRDDHGGKRIFKDVLYRYVPRALLDRPKMGFGVPIEDWLRGPLREWAESLLSEQRLKQEGVLDAGPIRQMWLEHQSGERRWHYYLWDVLMFEAWLEQSNKERLAISAV